MILSLRHWRSSAFWIWHIAESGKARKGVSRSRTFLCQWTSRLHSISAVASVGYGFYNGFLYKIFNLLVVLSWSSKEVKDNFVSLLQSKITLYRHHTVRSQLRIGRPRRIAHRASELREYGVWEWQKRNVPFSSFILALHSPLRLYAPGRFWLFCLSGWEFSVDYSIICPLNLPSMQDCNHFSKKQF